MASIRTVYPVYQQGLYGAEFRTLGSVATGGGKQPTFRTAWAQHTVRPQYTLLSARSMGPNSSVTCAAWRNAPPGRPTQWSSPSTYSSTALSVSTSTQLPTIYEHSPYYQSLCKCTCTAWAPFVSARVCSSYAWVRCVQLSVPSLPNPSSGVLWARLNKRRFIHNCMDMILCGVESTHKPLHAGPTTCRSTFLRNQIMKEFL